MATKFDFNKFFINADYNGQLAITDALAKWAANPTDQPSWVTATIWPVLDPTGVGYFMASAMEKFIAEYDNTLKITSASLDAATDYSYANRATITWAVT